MTDLPGRPDASTGHHADETAPARPIGTFSCVVDQHPRFHQEALRWFASLTTIAGVDPHDLARRGRARLREIHESSIAELEQGLSPDLRAELRRLSLPFGDGIPSEAELRIAQAQLVGWLEGLFHGIQATLFAQQMAARAQLEEMRTRALPPGQGQPQQGGQSGSGLYL